MLRWPDSQAVGQALETWTQQAVQTVPSITRIGYFGSYARGDWGVGSDLDLVVLVDHATCSFEERPSMLDTTSLPVPADLIIYTESEWEGMGHDSGFHARLQREVVWSYERQD